ncbi:MAG: sulfite exporter TauE/SafE family protein [Deltaproteobacteria bacterium]|jgi:uncharacterized protein|nr:sulfite exporter TauE/SafE family protein [Deltaproteobacteria bacterium]
MHFLSYIAIAFCLCLVAFVAAIFGIGGGGLYTPIQLFFDIGIHEAASTSLFLMIVLSIGATIIYQRARKVDWQLAIIFVIFTISGGFLGGYLSDFISSDVLTSILVLVMILCGATMLIQPERKHTDKLISRAFYVWNRAFDSRLYSVNLIIALPVCFAAGLLSGMIGIGGGILLVPMMAVFFNIPLDIAIATSGFMVGVTAIGGLSGHIFAAHVNWQRCLIFAPGILLGSMFGARFMLRVGKRRLKMAFGLLMFIMALGVILKSMKGS